MTQVKICGITSLADARYASGAGADFLGFIQYPDSPRFVEPQVAKEIINWVYGPRTVGVFVDADAEFVNSTCELAGFQFVQLHGDETPAYCEWIDRPIIKAIRVGTATSAVDILETMTAFQHVAEYFLLDTSTPSVFGGSGHAFNWDLLSGLHPPLPYFLAGGLSPLNVSEAIRKGTPFGVDVSSGVEERPGVKDFAKIDAFMTQIRAGANA